MRRPSYYPQLVVRPGPYPRTLLRRGSCENRDVGRLDSLIPSVSAASVCDGLSRRDFRKEPEMAQLLLRQPRSPTQGKSIAPLPSMKPSGLSPDEACDITDVVASLSQRPTRFLSGSVSWQDMEI